MKLTRTYRYFAVLVTALLLLLQGATLSHAASFGTDSHEHDGVQCVLSLNTQTAAIVPAPTLYVPAPALIDSPQPEFDFDFTSAPARDYRGREPPPRGPPSQQN